MIRYPLTRLYEEVAFLAYYLHWDHDQLLHMEHKQRQRWCQEVSKIHKKLNVDSGEVSIETIF